MPSIKQIEAFYWSGQLGSFVAAADRLNTTQSNISKRIQELEYTLGVNVFDRAKRTIRLTATGEELMKRSRTLLLAHLHVRELGKSALPIDGPFRFGVTEAVALTWLPQFSSLIQGRFAGLIPVSTVDSTVTLNTLLMDRKIDLAIGTEKNFDPSLVFLPLCRVERVWVASPRLVPHDRKLTTAEMSRLPILGHGDRSPQDSQVLARLRRHGVTPQIVTSCTSMSALAHMAAEGIGLTYLHRSVFAGEIASGQLKVVETELEIGPLEYVAAYRDDVISPAAQMVAAIALEACNFSRRSGVAA